ncbi:MAG: rod shape-determining protein RodA, rod shape determining protein RodA [Candidatus Parcubacteria bacterium]|jgi:rod shape determining protein RodA
MMLRTRYWWQGIDIWTLLPAMALTCFGLSSMYSFDTRLIFYEKQIIWFSAALVAFCIFQSLSYRFLRNTRPVLFIYIVAIFLLTLTLVVGSVLKGAKSWIDIGFFAIQPTEFAKFALIIVLAKYFSRRHIEIAHVQHILVSGFYAGLLFLLVMLQPDFGSALILGFIWFGMVLSSGISLRHLAALFCIGVASLACLWVFLFADYQKERILTFINPARDVRGAGYNAQQSVIAVGSGQLVGKGVGYGTQSKLRFLPEHQTDFIFAAFAEEWGFLGVLIVFMLFLVFIGRLYAYAWYGESTFESLVVIGYIAMIVGAFIVNVGMNLSIMPVTGVALPFMSYGGSHLLVEYVLLGMVTGMYRYAKTVHKQDYTREVL